MVYQLEYSKWYISWNTVADVSARVTYVSIFRAHSYSNQTWLFIFGDYYNFNAKGDYQGNVGISDGTFGLRVAGRTLASEVTSNWHRGTQSDAYSAELRTSLKTEVRTTESCL